MGLLVTMADGGIVNIDSDTESWRGCETCDYGSKYVNEYEFTMTKGTIKVNVSQMYEHALTEDFVMRTVIGNLDTIKAMTEAEFFNWIKQRVEQEVEAQGDGATVTVEWKGRE